MFDSDIKINLLLIQYLRMQVAEITDERMAEQPVAGVNHPAWILGHLAYSADGGRALLGAEKKLPASWTAQYGPGSKCSTLRSDYPSKDELVGAVCDGFERLREAVASASPEQLARPSTNPRMKDALPAVKDGIAFLLTGHLGVHLGQLSTWRRMIGLPHLF
jgi:hypothetical protein